MQTISKRTWQTNTALLQTWNRHGFVLVYNAALHERLCCINMKADWNINKVQYLNIARNKSSHKVVSKRVRQSTSYIKLERKKEITHKIFTINENSYSMGLTTRFKHKCSKIHGRRRKLLWKKNRNPKKKGQIFRFHFYFLILQASHCSNISNKNQNISKIIEHIFRWRKIRKTSAMSTINAERKINIQFLLCPSKVCLEIRGLAIIINFIYAHNFWYCCGRLTTRTC